MHLNGRPYEIDQGVTDLLVSLEGFVNLEINFDDLGEWIMFDISHVADWDKLPDHLLNLQRIGCCVASFDNIFVFSTRVAKRNSIKIVSPKGGIHFI